ncbi:GNAT family N-acetyltransferase [Robiginitalea sp. IMCC43444]|uniref:GNAT family N-acetyltransferase n=1 Tax=Robiginitalea sp. IMCC43444 TaxID=3459121 RepID=UPI00404154CA
MGNPFLSGCFQRVWLSHFGEGRQVLRLASIPEVPLIKNSKRPIFYNVGQTQTKGFSYSLKYSHTDEEKQGLCVVLFDIPSYSKSPHKSERMPFGLLRVPQYKGYRCNFQEINTLEGYMEKVISSRSRGKFGRTLRNFNSKFSLACKFYGQGTNKNKLEELLDLLNQWMSQRFSELKRYNNNLDPDEWAFHKDVTLALISEGKAGLFCVLNGDKPVALTILYLSETTAFDVIRSFDIEYAAYRPGTICTMKQIEWCIENGFKYLDFSKGHFEYKQRWCNEPYDFEYHILFDRKSLKAQFFACYFFGYYQLKTYLRRLGLDLIWQRLKYIQSSHK